MTKRSLAGIAGIVAIATLISKVFGLVRTQAIAATFAVGPVADAYGLAYAIPGFLLVLLGGINGPFHSAIVRGVANRKKDEIAPLVETITTLVGIGLLCVTAAIVIFAPAIIGILGNRLSENTAAGAITRDIAILQLRIMAPMAMFAGLIGIGFGTLNAADHYWLPSISPLFSSSAVILSLGAVFFTLGDKISEPRYALVGGAALAVGTLAGAVLQWLVQVPVLWKQGLGKLRLRFNTQDPAVKDVLHVLGPATFSSGMMQINVQVDLFFAAALPGTIAALDYANLLVQTPLGIISNVILVPFLPIFARLADPIHWDELKQRIRQGLMLTAVTMLPLSAIFITLALPMVRVVYERGAFDKNASQLVTSVLIAYGVGMFVYLGRDVLVRVFYALGDGDTPFRISLANIGLNALLDYLLINRYGAPGLVLATVGVNLVSMVALLICLSRKINGLPWLDWAKPLVLLILSSVLSGTAAWGSRLGLETWLGTEGFFVNLIVLCGAGAISLGVFVLAALALGIPEAKMVLQQLQAKLLRR
ncbi:murein biosynthesis integral membrane protein MurJ [Leptothoe sp. PORK10 BA2]|uniref:murein biosynthesis integral membrane protein MurJ n=1 Tax=Leptothoe sp. PORK10 BA2 TaxID=3110254 RepID=UPI002B1F7097|nr:murein biosynthesis integral membrane protein MurJ [Leptothoe sp. PORK10 BA2]MEA5463648.1 murein biosynthesis integral membrane protein MurJ [Leptothoe sp. PORK10 BA2]